MWADLGKYASLGRVYYSSGDRAPCMMVKIWGHRGGFEGIVSV